VGKKADTPKSYFMSTGLFYVFVLQYTDASVRQKLLGISDGHYRSRKVATEWLSNINYELQMVGSLIDKETEADVREVLRRMYEGMIKNGK